MPTPEDREINDGRKIKLSALVVDGDRVFEYLYDYGDGWCRVVVHRCTRSPAGMKRVYPARLGESEGTKWWTGRAPAHPREAVADDAAGFRSDARAAEPNRLLSLKCRRPQEGRPEPTKSRSSGSSKVFRSEQVADC
jgi:hypothetical protein